MTTTSAAQEGQTPRVTALLIDFGGVLTVPLRRAFGALADDAGLDPDAGLRFNAEKLLLDPYGKAV